MPIIMKSSDNGFVDAINKTVRFPGRPRAQRDLEEIRCATIVDCPLGGWSASSWSANAEVVHLRDGPAEEPRSGSGGDRLHRMAVGGMGEWAVIVSDSSPGVPLAIDGFQYSPFELGAGGGEKVEMGDPGGSRDGVEVAYFPEIECYRAEVLAGCEAAMVTEAILGDAPGIAPKQVRRRRVAA